MDGAYLGGGPLEVRATPNPSGMLVVLLSGGPGSQALPLGLVAWVARLEARVLAHVHGVDGVNLPRARSRVGLDMCIAPDRVFAVEKAVPGDAHGVEGVLAWNDPRVTNAGFGGGR